MSIKTLSIHDMSLETRAKRAAQAKRQLQSLLSNPQLTLEQRQELTDQLKVIGKAERLDVDANVTTYEAKTRVPVNHSVDVIEAVSVDEN